MNKYMDLAIKEAKTAYRKKEIPVGAVIVRNDKVVSLGRNDRRKKKDVSSHAEINAINKAIKKLNTTHLDECSMYVSLEPCPMCAYAIMEAHISKLYIGAKDNKRGAISTLDMFNKGLGSKVEVYDIIEEEASDLLKSFFKDKR